MTAAVLAGAAVPSYRRPPPVTIPELGAAAYAGTVGALAVAAALLMKRWRPV